MAMNPRCSARANVSRRLALGAFWVAVAGSGPAAAAGPTATTFTPSGPITLVSGQVVSGLHISNPNGPCIWGGSVSNVRITNNRIGPCGPDALGVGVKLDLSSSVRIDHNAFDDVASALSAVEGGNGIVFEQNVVTRIRGPLPRGQMVQFDKVRGSGHRIQCNVSDQTTPGYLGGPEDHISIYKSAGTAASPIDIAYNKLRGGGPSPSGGGIIAGDFGSEYVVVRDNILVHPGQYGIAIAGGHDLRLLRNRVYSATVFPWSNIGAYVWAQDASACYGHEVRGNHVFYLGNVGPNPYWNAGNCGTVAGEADNLWEWGTSTTLTAAIWDEPIAACAEPAAPAAPANLAASAAPGVAPANVALTWTDQAGNEDSFVVERAAAGGSYGVIASLPANASAYTDAGRPAGSWSYRVKAANAGGDSAYSNVVSVTITAATQTTGTLLPSANGTYREWSGAAFNNVAEATCDGTATYASTTSTGARVSYRVSLAAVPIGATVTGITITPCASRHLGGSGAATMDVFYRWNNSNGPAAGGYALAGTTPASLAPTSFSGLALARTSGSTLDIGARYSAGTRGARLSRIAVVIQYRAP